MKKKLAFIRSDIKGIKRCPFGLHIVGACLNAGNSTTHMCPLEFVDKEKKEQVIKANSRVYVYHKTGDRCIYAANVMENNGVVNCDFGDTAAGMHSPAFVGSPLYAQSFSGVGLDGLYAFPMGFYADNNTSRNLFEGLFSLVGTTDNSEIVKEAILSNPKMKTIVSKLEDGLKLTTEEILDLEKIVIELRSI